MYFSVYGSVGLKTFRARAPQPNCQPKVGQHVQKFNRGAYQENAVKPGAHFGISEQWLVS